MRRPTLEDVARGQELRLARSRPDSGVIARSDQGAPKPGLRRSAEMRRSAEEWHSLLTGAAIAAGADPRRARERMAQVAQILVLSREAEGMMQRLEEWMGHHGDRSVTIRGTADGWSGVRSPGPGPEQPSREPTLEALITKLAIGIDPVD